MVRRRTINYLHVQHAIQHATHVGRLSIGKRCVAQELT